MKVLRQARRGCEEKNQVARDVERLDRLDRLEPGTTSVPSQAELTPATSPQALA